MELLHLLPDKIISHQGSHFVAKFWRELLILVGINQALSSAYHPESDGLTEHLKWGSRTVPVSLCNQQMDWVDLLHYAE